MTRHTAYRELDLGRAARLMRTRVLVDGRNAFDSAAAAEAGFVMRSIGKGASYAVDEGQLLGRQPCGWGACAESLAFFAQGSDR